MENRERRGKEKREGKIRSGGAERIKKRVKRQEQEGQRGRDGVGWVLTDPKLTSFHYSAVPLGTSSSKPFITKLYRLIG